MDAGTFGSPDDGSQVMDIFNAVEEHQKGNLAFRFSIGQHISQICKVNSRCHSHDALMAFIRCQAVQYFRRDIFDENALFTSQFPDAFQSRRLIACSQIDFRNGPACPQRFSHAVAADNHTLITHDISSSGMCHAAILLRMCIDLFHNGLQPFLLVRQDQVSDERFQSCTVMVFSNGSTFRCL